MKNNDNRFSVGDKVILSTTSINNSLNDLNGIIKQFYVRSGTDHVIIEFDIELTWYQRSLLAHAYDMETRCVTLSKRINDEYVAVGSDMRRGLRLLAKYGDNTTNDTDSILGEFDTTLDDPFKFLSDLPEDYLNVISDFPETVSNEKPDTISVGDCVKMGEAFYYVRKVRADEILCTELTIDSIRETRLDLDEFDTFVKIDEDDFCELYRIVNNRLAIY